MVCYKKSCSRLLGALLALLATPVLAGTMICCQNPATGRKVCADSLPEVCRGQAYRILDAQGAVIREVGPPLTAEQKAQKELEARQKKEQDEHAREQRRRDSALLETFSSAQEIDKVQAKAEDEILQAMRMAESRITEATRRRQRLEAEADGYNQRGQKAEWTKLTKDADFELTAQRNLLQSKQRDLEAVRTKYADYKRRYLELTTGRGSVGAYPGATSTTPPKTGEKR